MSYPELALIAATRGMLGVGIGLLISGRLGEQRRVAVGATLAIIGALSTIPLAFEVLGRYRGASKGSRTELSPPGPGEARGERSSALM